MTRNLLMVLAMSAAMLGCAGLVVAPEFNGTQSFKGVKWGMSPDKIQVVIDRDLKKLDPMKYYMGDVMYGMPCRTTFEFGPRQNLKAVSVEYEVSNPDAEYDFIIKNISELYGSPKKNSRQTGVVWHSADTAVVLLMTGEVEKELKLSFIQKEK